MEIYRLTRPSWSQITVHLHEAKTFLLVKVRVASGAQRVQERCDLRSASQLHIRSMPESQ